jgi:hypothetical protein
MKSKEREIMIADLEQAASCIAEGERRIARQRQIIAGLKCRRGPRNSEALRKALELLQTLELAQQADLADRDRLRAALAEDTREGQPEPPYQR